MIENVSLRLAARLPFYQRTHPKTAPCSKDAVRKAFGEACAQYFYASNIKHLRALTLPGPWWVFEHRFGVQRRRRGNCQFIACEKEPLIFRTAASRMPGLGNGKYRSKFCAELDNADVATSQHCCLINCDVLDYVKVTDKRFELIWLDFGSPLTGRIISGIEDSLKRLSDGPVIFAMSYLCGRESLETQRIMYPTRTRTQFIKSLVEPEGFTMCGYWAWNDGSSMAQMMFKRNTGIEK